MGFGKLARTLRHEGPYQAAQRTYVDSPLGRVARPAARSCGGRSAPSANRVAIVSSDEPWQEPIASCQRVLDSSPVVGIRRSRRWRA